MKRNDTSLNSQDLFLSMWTIYSHPVDFPQDYVARLFVSDEGISAVTPTFIREPTLQRLRDRLLARHPGLMCLPRADADDPHIVETWM